MALQAASSSFSYNFYDGDGVQTDFVIGFLYLRTDDVFTTVDSVETTGWSFVNETTIRFDVPPPAGVANVFLFRSTSISTRLTTYKDAGVLGADQLNVDSIQAFFLCQEANDTAALAGPAAAQDAAESATESAASAAESAASAAAALVSENNASASAASLPNTTAGDALDYIRINAAGTGWDYLSVTEVQADLDIVPASSFDEQVWLTSQTFG